MESTRPHFRARRRASGGDHCGAFQCRVFTGCQLAKCVSHRYGTGAFIDRDRSARD
ncbi:Uncharacterised protein [Vibrio cholerae]|nr:Uncharacterised protein [Vibrio cholerae]